SGQTTHNTDQSAVWKLSRSGFGDDLDANGRVLGQFRSAGRKPVSAENEGDEVRVNTSTERAPGAVRHISADIIQQVIDSGLAEAFPEVLACKGLPFVSSASCDTMTTSAIGCEAANSTLGLFLGVHAIPNGFVLSGYSQLRGGRHNCT